MKKRTSIHDIAKHLGVSATTISFVLNGKAEEMRISEEVKKKVTTYIKEIGYQPNLIAKSLRTGKSQIIGMLVEDISDPFFSSIARGVERRAYDLGYKIFFASTENDTEIARALIKVFRERQVDAYIIAPSPGIKEDIQMLMEDEVPVILFDRYFPELTTNNIIVNNFEGANNAVQYLQKNGYRNITFVTLDSEQTQMTDRLQGYLEAIKKTKQKKCILKVPYSLDDDKIAEKIKLFFKKNHSSIDAVLFGTNYLALTGLEVINSLNINIPKELGVISFDDSDIFRLFSPTITAVAQPTDKIAEQVVKKVMSILSSKSPVTQAETIVLDTELVTRKSSLQKAEEKSLQL